MPNGVPLHNPRVTILSSSVFSALLKANVGDRVAQLQQDLAAATSERDLAALDLDHEREKVARLTTEYDTDIALVRKDIDALRAGATEQVCYLCF